MASVPTDDPSAAIPSSDERGRDACLRCGYDLRGVPDDAACPECGLGADRSRRPTDALRDARPAWLRSLAIGVRLMLLAVPIAIAGSLGAEWLLNVLIDYAQNALSTLTPWQFDVIVTLAELWGAYLGSVFLLAGAILVTRPEGYAPADLRDRRSRRWIRSLAAVPLLGLAAVHALGLAEVDGSRSVSMAIVVIAIALLLPLPIVGMSYLRSLATRLRSPHLAEHCIIVGWCAACSLLALVLMVLIFENAQDLGLGRHWTSNSDAALLLMLTTTTLAALSILWFTYVMVRFALFFARESRALRTAWRAADRSAAM